MSVRNGEELPSDDQDEAPTSVRVQPRSTEPQYHLRGDGAQCVHHHLMLEQRRRMEQINEQREQPQPMDGFDQEEKKDDVAQPHPPPYAVGINHPLRRVSRCRTYTEAEKFMLTQEASVIGVSATVRNHHFDLNPAASSLYSWIHSYRRARTRLGRDPVNLAEAGLTPRRSGANLALGRWDSEVLRMLMSFREGAIPITAHTFAQCVETVLRLNEPALLIDNFGPINPWARGLRQSFYRRHNLTMRRATSTRPNLTDLELTTNATRFADQVRGYIEEHNIPPSMVLNYDETSVPAAPDKSYTMEVRGVRTVRIAGKNDKRNITAVIGITQDGGMVAPQFLYKGSTELCLPRRGIFPPDYDVVPTPKHWSTTASKMRLVRNNIIPYLNRKRRELNLEEGNDFALLILDRHRTNLTAELHDLLRQNRILYVLVPPSMTDQCQPCDQQPNRIFKESIRNSFIRFHSNLLLAHIRSGRPVNTFKLDMRWGALKHRHAAWCTIAIETLRRRPHAIRDAFRRCGIPAA